MPVSLNISGKIDFSAIRKELDRFIRLLDRNDITKYVNSLITKTNIERNIGIKVRQAIRNDLRAKGIRNTDITRELVSGFHVEVETKTSSKGNIVKVISFTHKFKENPNEMFYWNGRNRKIPKVQFQSTYTPKILIYNVLNSGRSAKRNKKGDLAFIRPKVSPYLIFYLPKWKSFSPTDRTIMVKKRTKTSSTLPLHFEDHVKTIFEDFIDVSRSAIQRKIREVLSE